MESQTQSSGLAKTAESVTQTSAPVVHAESKPFEYTGNAWDGIPIEMYRHFGVELSRLDQRTSDKLRNIYSFYKKQDGVSNIGDLLLKVKEGERKLGRGGIQSGLDKLYNWVGISEHIDSMQKQRKALED